MATIHFLNVGEGDCIVVQHNSDRVSMIDISCGNITEIEESTNRFIKSSGLAGANTGGNFNMKAYPTKPQNYLAGLGIKSIWRFILTHPDMDHLDGFNALLDQITVNNFWHSGADKPKPDFTGYNGYKEEDWDRYAKVRDDKDGGSRLSKLSQARSLSMRTKTTMAGAAMA